MPRTYAPNPNSLAARFAAQPGEELEGARLLPLDRIAVNPAQARQVFDAQALDELAASIAQHGVLQPIVVRPVGDGWQVVAGERRRRAAEIAGLDSIPAIILDKIDDEEAAYITAIENLQREDLDLADEARWVAQLQALTGESDVKLGERLGKSRMWVGRRIRLASGDPALFARIRAGELTIDAAIQELEHPPAPEPARGVHIPPEDSTPEEPPTPAPRTSRADLDSAPPTPAKWRAFYEWLTVRTIAPPVPPSARALLREQIDEVIEGLQAWRADLED